MFISKLANHGNDDFSRNIKNPVDNVNKNVTPSSPQKNINTDKNVNDSNIQNNNNFAIPAELFNQDNEKNLLKVPKFALAKILSPHHLLHMVDSKIKPRRI